MRKIINVAAGLSIFFALSIYGEETARAMKLCEALHKIYKGYWISIRAYQGDIKVGVAEYSPFTSQIKIKIFD